jgi:hypothetical protein
MQVGSLSAGGKSWWVCHSTDCLYWTGYLSAGGFVILQTTAYIGQVICPPVGLSFYRLPILDRLSVRRWNIIVGLSFYRLPIYWTGDLSDGPDTAGDDQRGRGHAGLVRHHQPGGGGGEPRGSARLEHRTPKTAAPCQNQCCGSVIFWYGSGSGSGSCYMYSSVTFKMTAKKFFAFYFF